MEAILRFQRRFLFNYKNSLGALSFKGYLIFRIVNPFFQMLFFCTVASYVYGTDNITPWVIGNALTLCYFSTFFGVGQTFIAERSQGTLKTILSAPTSTIHIVLPRVFMQAADALVSVAVGFITGFIFFGFTISLDVVLPCLVIILVSTFSAMGIGLLIGAFALLTRDINMLLNVFSMVLIALTGANFHVSLLPMSIQWISYCLPLTRGIQLMRLVVQGESFAAHQHLLFQEAALGILFFIIGFGVFKIVERLSVKHATLDLY